MNLLEFDEFAGQAEDDRARNVRKYLSTNGWRYTSQHPGSYWMWSITKSPAVPLTPITYAVNEATAIRIQRHWELEAQHFNAHDADCPIFETFKWEDCNCIVLDIAEGRADPDGAPIETGVENDTAALDGQADV